ELNDRVNLAVDAANRVCVTWAYQPDPALFPKRQVAARLYQFDGTSFTSLTHTFWPFVNRDSDGTLGMEGFHPYAVMTPRQICFAARGQVNSTNNPAGGPDIAADTDYYTVITHPAPLPPPKPNLSISLFEDYAVLDWDPDAGLFTVQSTPVVSPTSWT